MKKVFKKGYIFSFILGAIVFGSVGTYAAYSVLADNIGYTPKDNTWKKANGEDITNVKDAIDELYSKTTGPIINKIDFTKEKNISYGNWLTSRSVSLNLSSGSYIIILEQIDSYSSSSQSTTSVNNNITSSSDLVYSNGTCEIIDGDSVSIGSTSSFATTGVYVTAYSNTKLFKCVFTNDTTVSYTHTRPTAYNHVVEMYKLRYIKID